MTYGELITPVDKINKHHHHLYHKSVLVINVFWVLSCSTCQIEHPN